MKSARRRTTLAMLGAGLLAITISITFSREGAHAQQPATTPGELLVQLRPATSVGTASVSMASARTRAAETVVKANQQMAGRGEVVLVRVEPGVSVEAARAQLAQQPGVAFVEPNYRYTHQQLPNDPRYADGSLWGMFSDDKPKVLGPVGPNPPGTLTTNVFGIQAEKAWNASHTGKAEVVVAVLDEGVDINHPDLKDNIWTNPGETGKDSTGADKATNGKDDDGNGKIDDVHGWDFRSNDNTVFDGGASTPSIDSHGTHVAGTIGAKGNNNEGVAGVVWNVRIIPVKFLGPVDGSTSDAIKAIDYLIDLKKRHNLNLVAINHSWGGGGRSVLLHDALKRAARAGILSVCAAGNGGPDEIGDDNDSTPFYPSSYDTTQNTTADGGTPGEAFDAIIAVASITKSGTLARSSNFGKTRVDLAAPGEPILSTLPNGQYGEKGGTSMATPHVTGAIALFVSTHPKMTATQIRTVMLDTAKGVPTDAVKDKSVTGGRMSVAGF